MVSVSVHPPDLGSVAALFLPICHNAELSFAVLGKGHGKKAEA